MIRRILIGGLAAVGAITLLLGSAAAAFEYSFVGGSDYKVEESVMSPDSAYLATEYTVMGGGAAGWCSNIISVNSSSHPFSLSEEKSGSPHEVFSANCGAKVKVRWLSGCRLRIEVSKEYEYAGLDLFMGSHDASRIVQVEYALVP